MGGEINLESVEKLLKKRTSKQVVFSSFRVFKWTKKTRKQNAIICILSLIPSIFIGISPNTQTIFGDSCQTILEIIVGMFGVVFTGYSFFQALINKELLVRMIQSESIGDNGETKTKLQETNEAFVECMMLDLIFIFVSLFLKIVVACIPEDFLLFSTVWMSNLTAILGLFIYFYCIIVVFNEVKSFIFNVFQLFNIYAGTRVIQLFKDQNKD